MLRSLLTGLPSDPADRTALADALLKAEPFCRHPGLVKDIIEQVPSEEA